jgi:MerR family transcriptional regulator, copper efflux regulator
VGQLLRIGELAAQAGVSTRTVDYYTSLGLLQPAARTDAGYRLYSPSTIDMIITIRQFESHGVSLDEIAHSLERTGPIDITGVLSRLDADLVALRAATDTAAPSVHALLTTVAARAHAPITVAIEIAGASPLS